MIGITNEDNMELMKRYDDNHFDLAIVDPPYGINADENAHKNGINCKINGFKEHKKGSWDKSTPKKEYFTELQRVSKNQIIWGGNYFTEYLKEKIEYATGMKFEVDRVYANGQTIFNDGDWHRDMADNERNSAFVTALLYVSDITPENVNEVQGYTHFRLLNDDIVTIEPLKNRLVFFDSRVSHRGCAPSIPGFLRISLAWKLKRIK